jgi:hypothetical protein
MRIEEATQMYNEAMMTAKRILGKVLPELNSDAKHSLKDFGELVDIYKDTIESMKDAQKFMCMWADKGSDIEKKY